MINGKASSRGTAIGRGASCDPLIAFISSGKQIVTSAHRGHFGLSFSGGGSRPCITHIRKSPIAASVSARRISSSFT